MGNGNRLSATGKLQHTGQQHRLPLNYRPHNPSNAMDYRPLDNDASNAAAEQSADPRDSPGKITHGFWLQQYKWLHVDQPGERPQQAPPPPPSPPAPHLQQPAAVQTSKKAKQKLLIKWRNLKRTLGGSSGNVATKEPTPRQQCSAPSTAHSTLVKNSPSNVSPNRWPPRPVQASPGGGRLTPPSTIKRKSRAAGFLKSVSSSASSLLHVGAGYTHSRLRSPERGAPHGARSQSSSGVAPAARTGGDKTNDQQASPSRRASPYRQIGRALARTRNKVGLSPQRSRKRHKLTDDESQPLGADEREAALRQTQQVGAIDGGEENQATTGWRRSVQQTSGILGGIFVSPRLFRRKMSSPPIKPPVVGERAATMHSSAKIGGDVLINRKDEGVYYAGGNNEASRLAASQHNDSAPRLSLSDAERATAADGAIRVQVGARSNSNNDGREKLTGRHELVRANLEPAEPIVEVNATLSSQVEAASSSSSSSVGAAAAGLKQGPQDTQPSPAAKRISCQQISSHQAPKLDATQEAPRRVEEKTNEFKLEPSRESYANERRQSVADAHTSPVAALKMFTSKQTAIETGGNHCGNQNDDDEPVSPPPPQSSSSSSVKKKEEETIDAERETNKRKVAAGAPGSNLVLQPSASEQPAKSGASTSKLGPSVDFRPTIVPATTSSAESAGTCNNGAAAAMKRSPREEAKLGNQRQQQRQDGQLLQLIQPAAHSLASSSSSFASSSICLDSAASVSQDPLGGEPMAGVETAATGGISPDRQHSCRRQQQQDERPVSQPVDQGMGGLLRDNFKKLVKRQQSVDSYRMARELKKKQKQQNEPRQKHQSNEAIRQAGSSCSSSTRQSQQHSGRKFSMRTELGAGPKQLPMKITVDPYAQPGTSVLRELDDGNAPRTTTTVSNESRRKSVALSEKSDESAATSNRKAPKGGPTPPNTLNLMPVTGPASYMMGTFSGSITPTYPTHHLPSPKYVSPALEAKKYSNASTISSPFGGADTLASGNNAAGSRSNGQQANESTHDGAKGISDNESSPGAGGQAGSGTPSRSGTRARQMSTDQSSANGNQVMLMGMTNPQQHLHSPGSQTSKLQSACDEAAAAARRADLAEHIYDNKCGLSEDMKFLASLPELCDITFLVGETREPVCAVKSVLAARSRVFHKILFGNRMRRIARQQHQEEDLPASDGPLLISQDSSTAGPDRRGSSPKPPGGHKSLVGKPSSPQSRSTSPSQHQGWSVTSDARGYNTSPSPARGEQPVTRSRSGRASVVSSGRESVSRSMSGSQQPLIIGPGQTATPLSKKSKKSSLRDAAASAIGSSGSGHHQSSTGSRLSRMFLKRASDPSIKQQMHHHHHRGHPSAGHQLAHQQLGGSGSGGTSHTGSNSGQSYLDKMSSSQVSTTMIIEEFEPDVFRQLIEYIHTGCVLLQARTLLGLLNAADYYGLEQLRKACLRFVSCCITVDTVCSLLSTAERYIQYKCTKSIVQRVLEFVDTHANEIFKLNAFGLLPEHVVRLILARDGLQADEYVKYNGVYTWCEHYCRSYELTNISDVMTNFLGLINFHKIPTNLLLSEIYPTHIVPDTIFLSALAYQADPENFEPQPQRQRRMTLPNPITYKDYEDDNNDDEDDDRTGLATPLRPTGSQDAFRETGGSPASAGKRAADLAFTQEVTFAARQQPNKGRRKLSNQVAGGPSGSLAHGSPGGSQKSTEAKHESSKPAAEAKPKSRKGSIAQVSISGVKRLSHKLSIRKQAKATTSNERSKSSFSKQQSLASAGSRRAGRQSSRTSATSTSVNERDPLQVGQQILNAYLLSQKQRELEEEEQKRRVQAQRREEANRQQAIDVRINQADSGNAAGSTGGADSQQKDVTASNQHQHSESSSRRRSLRDFKHISRKIFMRHSSSKLQQQSNSSTLSSSGEHYAAVLPSAGAIESSRSINAAESSALEATASKQSQQNRRDLLRIKRSETVFESAAGSKTQQQAHVRGVSRVARLTHQLSSNFGSIGPYSSSSGSNK